jgi:hypothetical protein
MELLYGVGSPFTFMQRTFLDTKSFILICIWDYHSEVLNHTYKQFECRLHIPFPMIIIMGAKSRH